MCQSVEGRLRVEGETWSLDKCTFCLCHQGPLFLIISLLRWFCFVVTIVLAVVSPVFVCFYSFVAVTLFLFCLMLIFCCIFLFLLAYLFDFHTNKSLEMNEVFQAT